MAKKEIILGIRMKWWAKWLLMPILPSILFILYKSNRFDPDHVAEYLANHCFKYKVK